MSRCPDFPIVIVSNLRASAKTCGRFWLWRRYAMFLSLAAIMLSALLLPAVAQESVLLVGAGSTVPLPLYTKWAQEFNKTSHAAQMQYQPLGTSQGLKLVSGTKAELGKPELGKADFGAGEVVLTDKEREEGGLLQLPAVIIGIVPVYNLPGHPQLKFSGDLLAQIFLGRIKAWNAPQIARLNPGVSLPALPIKVVYRPGGKGTNYVFTDFLSKVSADFHSEVGRSASPKWPVGEPAERSSDMADKVKAESGAIGYVEVQYAASGGLGVGLVQNPAGKFVKASTETLLAACTAIEAPGWDKFAVSMTNAPGADSFPITSFTWIYLRTASGDARRRAALLNLLNWIFSTGQHIAIQQGYTQLPPQLLANLKTKIKGLD